MASYFLIVLCVETISEEPSEVHASEVNSTSKAVCGSSVEDEDDLSKAGSMIRSLFPAVAANILRGDCHCCRWVVVEVDVGG